MQDTGWQRSSISRYKACHRVCQDLGFFLQLMGRQHQQFMFNNMQLCTIGLMGLYAKLSYRSTGHVPLMAIKH